MKLLNTVRSRAVKHRSSHDGSSPSIELHSSYAAVDAKSHPSLLKCIKEPRSPRLQGVLNCGLFLAVFSLLFWFVWSIIFRHYYFFFSSTYFPGKSGSRIFMIMVVFYFMIGFLAILGAIYKISLPSSPLRMTKQVRIPVINEYYSFMELLVVFLYTVVQPIAIMMAVRQKLKSDMELYKWWYSLGKILGMSAVYSLMLLFFPISKRNFWLELFNLKFERAIKFHKMF